MGHKPPENPRKEGKFGTVGMLKVGRVFGGALSNQSFAGVSACGAFCACLASASLWAYMCVGGFVRLVITICLE